MRGMLLCAAALLAGCVEPTATGWKDFCADPKMGFDRMGTCLLHADLQAIEKRLQPPKAPKVVPPKCPAYDPDEVCEGEAARGAAAEYERKFEAMCATAQGMCLGMQGMGHWEDLDCADTCRFAGDGPTERGGKP